MAEQTKALQLTPSQAIEKAMSLPTLAKQFENAIGEKELQHFTASLVELYTDDTTLLKCNPQKIAREALKAAILRLSLSKSLGHACLVAYKKNFKVGKEWKSEYIPQFQLQWKGYVQLAQRTKEYEFIHADVVYRSEYKGRDKLTGEIDISGTVDPNNDEIVGYFAHFVMKSGFKKTEYMSVDEVKAHGKKFSKGYDNPKMPWQTNFDAMAKKTVVKALISKWGMLSIEAADGLDKVAKISNQIEYEENANSEPIDIDPETGEVVPIAQQEQERQEIDKALKQEFPAEEEDTGTAEDTGPPSEEDLRLEALENERIEREVDESYKKGLAEGAAATFRDLPSEPDFG